MADPMYRQIAEDLRRQIEAGELPPGAQLQTELELREKYDASRNTIRDAIKWLITRGLVETRPGQGTFVIERIIPFVTTLTGDPKTASAARASPTSSEVQAGPAGRERPAAGGDPGRPRPRSAAGTATSSRATPVVSRHQERFIDGTPWSLQTSFYPMSLVERGAPRLIQARTSPRAPSSTCVRRSASSRPATGTDHGPAARRD